MMSDGNPAKLQRISELLDGCCVEQQKLFQDVFFGFFHIDYYKQIWRMGCCCELVV